MTQIAIILTPGFADWEYALLGGTGTAFYGLGIAYFTSQPGELRSQGGLSVHVPADLDHLEACQPDVVVIVGGTVWETGTAPHIEPQIARLHAEGATVAGICGGTLALARAGLFARAVHTSNDRDYLLQHVSDYAGAEHYRSSPSAVVSNRVISAPGTAPVSFTAAIFDAVGLAPETVSQFRAMMKAEFQS